MSKFIIIFNIRILYQDVNVTLEGEMVRNLSVSLSFTLTINKKVKHYIRIKNP